MTVTNYQNYPQFSSGGGGGLSEPIVAQEVITSDYVNASVARATIVNAGSGGTPGSATVTGTTGTGTKFQAAVTIANSVASAVVNNAGDGSGTPGAVTITGTTGTGTKFQATGTVDGSGLLVGPLVVTVEGSYTVNPTTTGESVTSNAGLVAATVNLTLAGGALSSVNSISVAGSYTVPPTDETNEPVTGGGLTGAVLSLDMLFAPSIVGSNPTKGLFFDGAGRPGLRGSSSGLVLIDSGMITDPVQFLDIPLSVDYFRFWIAFENVRFSFHDSLVAVMSQDGGVSFINDTNSWDSYLLVSASTAGVVGTPSYGGIFHDVICDLQVANSEISSSIDVSVSPGTSTTFAQLRSISGGYWHPASLVGGAGLIWSTPNPDATITPSPGRINLLRFLPYGNGDCNPPTSGETILADTSWAVFGVPVP